MCMCQESSPNQSSVVTLCMMIRCETVTQALLLRLRTDATQLCHGPPKHAVGPPGMLWTPQTS